MKHGFIFLKMMVTHARDSREWMREGGGRGDLKCDAFCLRVWKRNHLIEICNHPASNPPVLYYIYAQYQRIRLCVITNRSDTCESSADADTVIARIDIHL